MQILARIWPRRTPPLFFRHFLPWRFLYWLDKRVPVCWAGVVMWKQGYKDWSWWPSCTCFHPDDNCYKFQKYLDDGMDPDELVRRVLEREALPELKARSDEEEGSWAATGR
jgi:hypothetical protein